MPGQWKSLQIVVFVIGILMVSVAQAASDREKLLSETGVYGTFAVFKMAEDWWKLDKDLRSKSAAEVNTIFQKHAQWVVTDTVLVRGLSERADFFIRVHSTELLSNQNFLLDLMGTTLGKHMINTDTFNGITKKANYIPSFPEDLKAAMKTPTDPGVKPYAIVVPIRKDALWWIMDDDDRNQMMKEHAEATIKYLKTVKRKLYHSSGLDDFDFITYFETAKPEDFNNLIIALLGVNENRHNNQFGTPTLIGTIRSLEEILEILTR